MLKIGMIGMSEGNGHPYSWAAIINGNYNEEQMSKCGYSGIPVYLDANRNTLGVQGAKVTHVWAQDIKIAEHIAAASLIDNTVDQLEDMIGKVDAVILARDDPQNHVQMAKPFIDADIPIFIDKPLTISTEDLRYFKSEVEKGKLIMSCSSTRYAVESQTAKIDLKPMGIIELATAVGKKDWVKYGVHMLEGLFALLGDPNAVTVKHISKSKKDIVYIEFETGCVATVHLFYDISPTFQISLFGTNSWKMIEYKNWYAMFRNNIIEFVRSVEEGRMRLLFNKTENIIKTLIAAQDSLDQGGKTISLEQS